MIILDTNICVELLRGNTTVISNRRSTTEDVAVCFITEADLFYGARKSNRPAKNAELVKQFLLSVISIHSDRVIMEQFGSLKAQLVERGQILPDADILIAAVALTRSKKFKQKNNKLIR